MSRERRIFELPRQVQDMFAGLPPTSHPRTKVYHESQTSLLCGRHCLNNLLQYPCFENRHLHEISHTLHALEQSVRDPNEQSSVNRYGNDQYGYFNVQVIECALESLNLSLKAFHTGVNLYSIQTGFIIHQRNHWFAIRKINNKWYNLDSKSKVPGERGKPMLIESPNDLYVKLGEIMSGGGLVFFVEGDLPNGSTVVARGFGSYFDIRDVKTERFYQKRAEEIERKNSAEEKAQEKPARAPHVAQENSDSKDQPEKENKPEPKSDAEIPDSNKTQPKSHEKAIPKNETVQLCTHTRMPFDDSVCFDGRFFTRRGRLCLNRDVSWRYSPYCGW